KQTTGLGFVSVVKQLKAAVQDSGGWPSAAVAIRRQRLLCSFQANENQPSVFCFFFRQCKKEKKSRKLNFYS
ncbi:hypothetical protein ACFPH8_09120, partial [Bizionia hallyeonensis]